MLLSVQQTVLGHNNPNITFGYAETYETTMRQATEELGKLNSPNMQR